MSLLHRCSPRSTDVDKERSGGGHPAGSASPETCWDPREGTLPGDGQDSGMKDNTLQHHGWKIQVCACVCVCVCVKALKDLDPQLKV